jgi:RNA polymerase sigma-70 factor (ECF subfamily)
VDGRAALVEAWTRCRPRLYVLCRRWLGGSAVDAEDVLSQVVIRAIEEHGSAGAISNYVGWLTRIARNQCMDVHRERACQHRMLDNVAIQAYVAGLGSYEDHPEADHLRWELGERIHLAIDALPPRLREPCKRRFLEEMPYERIAAELCLTNETVRKRIQEARTLLHRGLSGAREDGRPMRARSRAR